MGVKKSFRTRMLETFAGRMIEEKVSENVKVKLQEAFTSDDFKEESKKRFQEFVQDPVSKRREDIGWRPLTLSPTKDLNPLTQQKMHQISYFLYDKNGIGHRMVERYKDFVIGDGIVYDTDDKEVKKVLDEHWNDYDNNWEEYQYEFAKELSIYGEQAYPTFVNSENGHVKLGYIDPTNIDKVNTDPNNVKKKISYNYHVSNSTEPNIKTLVNLDKDSDLLEGESFLFLINNVTNAARGRSDLFPIADAIDAYENFLFNRAERADIINRIIYDLKMEGKNTDQIQEFLRDFELPKSNEIFGHNEKTELNIKVPELASDDATNEAKLLFNHILAGGGFPPTWFASGEGLTKGTAMMMDLPTKKQLKSRQRKIRSSLLYIFRYVIHQAVKAKTLKDNQKDAKINIDLPKIEEKEVQTMTTSLVNLTNSLTVAIEEKWITSETAQKVYAFFLSQIGKEVDPEIEKKRQAKIPESLDSKTKAIYLKKDLIDAKSNGEEVEEDI